MEKGIKNLDESQVDVFTGESIEAYKKARKEKEKNCKPAAN